MNNRPKDSQGSEAPMEQVREILFGAQLKDMEARFQRQEDRFVREIADTRESLKKRIDSLENFMKSEVSSLLSRLKEEQIEREQTIRAEQQSRLESIRAEQRDRLEALKSEQRDRAEADNQLTGDLVAATDSFERRLAKLSNTLDSAERELRQLLLSEASSLTDKIERKYADALSVLGKTASQIRSDMVYRTSLSGMFTEMVMGLSKPWNTEMANLPEEEYQPVAENLSVSETEQRHEPHQVEGPSNEYEVQPPRVGSADNY